MWHGNGRGHESQAQTPEAIPGWLSSVQTEQARKGHGEETWPSRVRQTAERSGGRARFEQYHITCRRVAKRVAKRAKLDILKLQKNGEEENAHASYQNDHRFRGARSRAARHAHG